MYSVESRFFSGWCMFLKNLGNLVMVLGITLPISICSAGNSSFDSASEVSIGAIASSQMSMKQKNISEEISDVSTLNHSSGVSCTDISQGEPNSEIVDTNSNKGNDNNNLKLSYSEFQQKEGDTENPGDKNDDFDALLTVSKGEEKALIEYKYFKNRAKKLDDMLHVELNIARRKFPDGKFDSVTLNKLQKLSKKIAEYNLKAGICDSNRRLLNYGRCTEVLRKCEAIDEAAEIIKANKEKVLNCEYISFNSILKKFERILFSLYEDDGVSFDSLEILLWEGIIKSGIDSNFKIVRYIDEHGYLRSYLKYGNEKFNTSFGKNFAVGIYKMEK